MNRSYPLTILPRVTTTFLAMAILTLSACASVAPPKEIPDTKGLTPCTEPRPQLCTMDYQPVCGQLQSGEFKTYSNGCGSCTDPAVVGYRAGECETGK